MNALTSPSYFHAEVKGELLYSGWQHTDHLQLDLYGTKPTDDDGYVVETVTVHGHDVPITELFTGSQLVDMAEWLQFKDDTNPTLRRHAVDKKHAATQGPWEKNRGMY